MTPYARIVCLIATLLVGVVACAGAFRWPIPHGVTTTMLLAAFSLFMAAVMQSDIEPEPDPDPDPGPGDDDRPDDDPAQPRSGGGSPA